MYKVVKSVTFTFLCIFELRLNFEIIFKKKDFQKKLSRNCFPVKSCFYLQMGPTYHSEYHIFTGGPCARFPAISIFVVFWPLRVILWWPLTLTQFLSIHHSKIICDPLALNLPIIMNSLTFFSKFNFWRFYPKIQKAQISKTEIFQYHNMQHNPIYLGYLLRNLNKMKVPYYRSKSHSWLALNTFQEAKSQGLRVDYHHVV